MKWKELIGGVVGAFAGVWISSKLGLLIPLMCLLIVLMLIDYISGLLAAKKEALEYPDNKEYGWSSKKSVLGIYKKVGYILTIFIAICIDYLIYRFADELGLQHNSGTIFSLLITFWFVINEILSILENIGRMGVELPNFLKNILTELKNGVNNKDL